MRNKVIKVLSLEHGQRVKNYFESLGFDTTGVRFNCIDRYYGFKEGNHRSCY